MSLNDAVYELSRSKIREFSALAKATPDCKALTLGEPDFDTPAVIEHAVQEAFDRGETHYIPNNGTGELLERIARFERENNGADYKEDEIIVTSGATEGLFTALFTILNPLDEVIIPVPAFSLYGEIVKMCRGVVVPLDTESDGFQIRGDKLQSLITERTKAVILNSPNNPTGCVLDKESLQSVHDCVKGKDIYVICDDVYRQLIYVDDYHSFTEYRDLRKQIILVQSFSKPYAMTGWRMGYIAMDAEVKERAELVHQFTVVSTPAPFQRACIKALDSDTEVFLNTYRKRRTYCMQRLEEIGLDYFKPQGAFYIYPSIKKFHMNSDTFARRMIKEEGLAVTPGSAFGNDNRIRLTYCYSDEDLTVGFDRLERFVRRIEREEG